MQKFASLLPISSVVSTRSGGTFDPEGLKRRLEVLHEESSSPGLWNDAQRAKTVLRDQSRLSSMIDRFAGLTATYEEAATLLELALEEDDPPTVAEVVELVATTLEKVRQLETELLLSGPLDHAGAIVLLSHGEGGADAMDWTEMLLRMYRRWCDVRGFKTEIVEILPGPEAGITKATFTADGPYAYGLLHAEAGVHRLVRISEFSGRRETSHAAVDVIPQIEDDIEIDIREADLRIDTYRAGGHGGQKVNKTDSAVRITHLPSGIVVQCQNERSQHKNKAMAMRILRSRLFEQEMDKRKEAEETQYAQKARAGFGHRIRSYVLHPYRMVKDERTGLEVGNVDAVLDGQIDSFVEAFLLQNAEAAHASKD
jgi:peptide chain release factor 2